MVQSPSQLVRYHATPRISANELARFMTAGEIGRRGIIRRSREMSTAVAVRYADARSTLRSAICDLVNEKRIISSARAVFEQKSDDSALSQWSREDASKSIDVLDAFTKMRNQITSFDCHTIAPGQPHLQIGGVSVSVNCDFLIRRDIKGQPSIGGGLFRLTKPEEDETPSAKQKRIEIGTYAATLVLMQVQQNLSDGARVNPEICLSIDVQSGEIHKAPKNYKTKSNNLEAACEVIAAMWDRE